MQAKIPLKQFYEQYILEEWFSTILMLRPFNTEFLMS